MGDYELYTPWLGRKLDRHPHATVAILTVSLFIPIYAGVYKGIDLVKNAAQERAPSHIEKIVAE